MKYTAQLRRGSFQDHKRVLEFDVFEDGIAIARATRPTGGNFFNGITWRFYTQGSRNRFEEFVGSNSMSEACESLCHGQVPLIGKP